MNATSYATTVITLFLALSVDVTYVSAFRQGVRGVERPCLPYRSTSLVRCRSQLSDTRELTKIFGRLSDKMLLLDVPGAGTPEMMNCCHGGCDNCDFSHIFDNLAAGRPKWVPLYAYRQLIDGRDHTSPWASIFDGDNQAINESTFVDRIKELPYRMTMGPPSSVPADEAPNDDTLQELWQKLTATLRGMGEEIESTITASQMAKALVELTGESHGVMWADFKKAMES